MAQTIYPENGDAVEATAHYNLTTALACGASFIVAGYGVSDNGGLSVTISPGVALVGGRLISDNTSNNLSITDNDTRYVYLESDGTFTELASADEDKDERLLLAVVTTSGADISSISHNLFLQSLNNDTYGPGSLTLISTGLNIGYDALVELESDETTSSNTTVAELSGLVFGADDGQKWEFEYVLHINSPAAADFKYRIETNAGSPYGQHHVQNPDGSLGTLVSVGSTDTTVATDGTDQVIIIRGYINLANAGAAWALKWAQATSDVGTSTVKAGSYVRAKRILM